MQPTNYTPPYGALLQPPQTVSTYDACVCTTADAFGCTNNHNAQHFSKHALTQDQMPARILRRPGLKVKDAQYACAALPTACTGSDPLSADASEDLKAATERLADSPNRYQRDL